MSRSFKKNPIIKHTDHGYKKIANRKYRRKSKESVQKGSEVAPIMNEVIEPYDVQEGRSIIDKKDLTEYNKAKRK